MKKPIIGVVPTFNLTNEDNDPYKDIAKFVTMYEREIVKAGGIPIGIISKDVSMYKDLCDGYLFPGGSKIISEHYPLMYDALENKKPVLGICLGCQTMGNFFNVIEDKEKDPDLNDNEIYDKYKISNPYLKRAINESMHNHKISKDKESIEATKHEINIEDNTFLHDIYKCSSMEVVSLHSNVIARTHRDVIVGAKSSDGVIESIEYHKDGNKFLGLMFHPEVIEDNKPFEWLVDNCKKEDK